MRRFQLLAGVAVYNDVGDRAIILAISTYALGSPSYFTPGEPSLLTGLLGLFWRQLPQPPLMLEPSWLFHDRG